MSLSLTAVSGSSLAVLKHVRQTNLIQMPLLVILLRLHKKHKDNIAQTTPSENNNLRFIILRNLVRIHWLSYIFIVCIQIV